MTAPLDTTQLPLNGFSPKGAEADGERPALSLFVIGYPSYLGGADTELWHTIKLWRRKGIAVNLIPTWHAQREWREKLNAIGATTYEVDPSKLAEVPGLAGSPVVSFCNGEFLLHAGKFRELGCPIVWANCMTWIFPKEIEHYERHGAFEAYMFQSAFQRSCLLPTLHEHGVKDEQCFQIPGAFAVDEFPFNPSSHRPGEPFVMGRIARPDLDKWSSNLWSIYGSVQYTHRRARVMAWDNRLTQKCGAPPDWVEPLSANAEPSRKFLESLHCMFPINGGARENWPRSGLEAMASGVPVVAQNQWGWQEMIEHGVTGFLGNDDCELAHYTAMLAHDEELRLEMALQARKRLVEELASSERIADQWVRLLGTLAPKG